MRLEGLALGRARDALSGGGGGPPRDVSGCLKSSAPVTHLPSREGASSECDPGLPKLTRACAPSSGRMKFSEALSWLVSGSPGADGGVLWCRVPTVGGAGHSVH